jgi:hypothetical protein
MATTYSELKSEIANWGHRNSTAFIAAIPTFIRFAESEFNRRLRVRAMETVATGTLSSNPLSLADGGDFTRYLKMKSFSVNAGGIDRVLNYVSPDLTAASFATLATGIPEYYTLIGNSLYADPAPDGSYTFTAYYYQGLQSLSDTVTTNWLLTRSPDLYESASLFYAAVFNRNAEAAQGFKMMKDEAIALIKQEDVRDRSGGTSRMRSEVRAV